MLCDEIKDWWETAGFSCTYQYVIYAVLQLNEIQINIVKNKHSSKNMQEKITEKMSQYHMFTCLKMWYSKRK